MTIKQVLRRRLAGLLFGQVISVFWMISAARWSGMNEEAGFVALGIGLVVLAFLGLVALFIIKCPKCRTVPAFFFARTECGRCGLAFSNLWPYEQRKGTEEGSLPKGRTGWLVVIGVAIFYGLMIGVGKLSESMVVKGVVGCASSWVGAFLFVWAYFKEEESVIFRIIMWVCRNFSFPPGRGMALFYAALLIFCGFMSLVVSGIL